MSVAWAPVLNARSYNIYYARQPGITPQNYASLTGGAKVNVESQPHTIRNLTNGTSMYVVVTAVADGFESNPTGQMETVVQMPVALPRQGTGLLPDTGMDWCANLFNIRLACPVAEFEGQDAQQGRDSHAQTLNKVGSGDAGFDFTKLDSNGAPLDVSAAEWICVHDNFTGLTWEVKTRDYELRDFRNYYTWYEPDARKNGGNAGVRDGGVCVGLQCDTQGYVQAVNELGLCGHNDWRLPTRTELLGIVNFGRRQPAIDTNFFPDFPPRDLMPSRTWTSNSSGNSMTLGSMAYQIDFDPGWPRLYPKRDYGLIRLVRGEPREAP